MFIRLQLLICLLPFLWALGSLGTATRVSWRVSWIEQRWMDECILVDQYSCSSSSVWPVILLVFWMSADATISPFPDPLFPHWLQTSNLVGFCDLNQILWSWWLAQFAQNTSAYNILISKSCLHSVNDCKDHKRKSSWKYSNFSLILFCIYQTHNQLDLMLKETFPPEVAITTLVQAFSFPLTLLRGTT